ncbi:hypothetical protein SZ54_0405 [Rhizobium sp. UR51a]|nr:hypothetical protein SZ54_0405 [Rhizobium sp. UR51a]
MRRSNSLQHASTISGRRPPCGATIAPPTALFRARFILVTGRADSI